MMWRDDKPTLAYWVTLGVVLTLALGLWGLLGYTIIHFARKFW